MAEVGGAGAGPNPAMIGQLPTEIQQMVGAFLSPEDLAKAGGASQVMRSVFNSPAMWLQLANKIRLEVRDQQNPRPEIEAFYARTNKFICDTLKIEMPKGNVFEQNAFLRDYLKRASWRYERLQEATTEANHAIFPDILLLDWIQSSDWALTDMVRERNFNKKLVERLIKLGGGGQRVDRNGRSNGPLIMKGDLENLKWLVNEQGVPLHRGALYDAVMYNRLEIVRFLILEKGFKPSQRDIEKAEELEDEELIHFLRAHLPPSGRAGPGAGAAEG